MCFIEGRYVDARNYYNEALEMRRKVYESSGGVHADIASSLYALGQECFRMGQYADVRNYYNEALEMRKKSTSLQEAYMLIWHRVFVFWV